MRRAFGICLCESCLREISDFFRRFDVKLQHWCGVEGIFGLGGAPVLEFRCTLFASELRGRNSDALQKAAGCIVWRCVPGVARRQLTFLASPRKVSQRRRPQVRRPSGALRYSSRPAAAQLGREFITPRVPVSSRPQTVLADCPGRACVAQRLAWGPSRKVTCAAAA